MGNYLFTSESVCRGHPDKIADQIADAILDACLASDPHSRVSCEVLLSTGLVVLAGEITTHALIDYQAIARDVIKNIGYSDCSLGFDYRSCGIMITINKQSPDIARGITNGITHEITDGITHGIHITNEHHDLGAGDHGIHITNEHHDLGAGDQGIMFGYASDETPELMPMPIMVAHKIVRELEVLRKSKAFSYLRPDGKTQVTFEYDENGAPFRLHTVVISVQHSENVDLETINKDMKELVYRLVPNNFIDDKTLFYINPTGRFVIGGPTADCGMTGRKIIVDTYGGMGRHGGGAFSGKDPTKVDRSAAYAARYVAKNIVAAKLAKKCEVQISYAIGVSKPISIKVETFGTGILKDDHLNALIMKNFDLSPKGIIEMLDLNRPIYQKTAFGGHFGRIEEEFTWEKIDRAHFMR